MMNTNLPKLSWDAATGYDFFVSLHVLHVPDEFALRPSWAKGVRTRLPADARGFFEETSKHLLSALSFVHSLPAPRNAKTVLKALEALPPEKRFARLLTTPEIPAEILLVLERIAEKESWSKEDSDEILSRKNSFKGGDKELAKMLNLWARAAELGRKTLESLQAYYEVFFEEEEARLLPALEKAVIRGKDLSSKKTFFELLESLSEGIQFDNPALPRLNWTMIPAFWISPRVMVWHESEDEALFIHGGRSDEDSLVPGEAVPDALYVTLKALADPTRLRILHYMQAQPRTPSELAKTLRLRAPTVIHHLNSLRLAGLVYVTYGKGDKRYAARTGRISEMYLQLRRYLGVSETKRLEELSGRPPYIA